MKYINKRIAILGATGHIAKGLIWHFIQNTEYALFLFARSPEKVKDFLSHHALERSVGVADIGTFPDGNYDIIINCVGIGSLRRLKEDASVGILTEQYDQMLMAYLSSHPLCRLINLSSGAVTQGLQDQYTIAKINSEIKHRLRIDLSIVDIRVYGYFSRFIDLESGFFLTDIIQSVRAHVDFKTSADNFSRDYVHPSDLFQLVQKVMDAPLMNCALEAYSTKPIHKFEVLDFFKQRYGLSYTVLNSVDESSPTGFKKEYGAVSNGACMLGYTPQWSSMEAIIQESAQILIDQMSKECA